VTAAGLWRDTGVYTSPRNIHRTKNPCRSSGGGFAFDPLQTQSSTRMGFPRSTVGISRKDLTQDRLWDLRLWPGCETVVGVGVPAGQNGKFTPSCD
jgi:hypothetical protein